MTTATPHSLDAEASVLGGVLLRNEVLRGLDLVVEDFYSPRHQAVFQAMRNLEARAQPIDAMTVTAEMERVGKAEAVGGLGFVTELMLRVPSAENVRHYAVGIVLHAQRRRAILAMSDGIHRLSTCADEDADDVLLEVSGELQRIDSRKPDPTIALGDSMRAEMAQIQRDVGARDEGHHVGGIPTGLHVLDALTGGLPVGKLTLVVAETGHGKSTLAMAFLRAAVEQAGDEPLLFSYEDNQQSFAQRGLAQESGVPTSVIARRAFRVLDMRAMATLTGERIRGRRERIARFHGESVEELCRTVTRLRARGPIKGGKTCGQLVIVDYLQRIPRPRKFGLSTPEAIGEIAATLEDLADREQCAVVALSQVNDEVMRREDHRPQGRDCAGSRDPFKICKLCLGLYRPRMYEPGADESLGYLGVLKNNQGPAPGWQQPIELVLNLETHVIRDAGYEAPAHEQRRMGGI